MGEVGIDHSGLTQLMKHLEEEKAPFRKTITIRTTRNPNDSRCSRYFSEGPDFSQHFSKGYNYRGHISEIKFSHPVRDNKGRAHKKLWLKTAWFYGRFEANPYWNQWLDDEDKCVLVSRGDFGRLDEDFSSYSKERLREWQKLGLNTHEGVLSKLNELYFNGQEVTIPENFLER